MVLVLYDEPPYQLKCLLDTKYIKGQTNNSDIFQVSELASILCQLAIGLEFRIFCEGTLQYLITNSDKGMPASFARFPHLPSPRQKEGGGRRNGTYLA
jgi:hypothetical protein